MKTLIREKILEFMIKRMNVLDEQIIRDFSGGVQSRVFEYREVKYWKEAIERGEFDGGEVYVILSKEHPEIVDSTYYTDIDKVSKRVEYLNLISKGNNFWYYTLYPSFRN